MLNLLILVSVSRLFSGLRMLPRAGVRTFCLEHGISREKFHAIRKGAVMQLCKRLQISDQTFYRWRLEYGALKEDEAQRLKALELIGAGTAPLLLVRPDGAAHPDVDQRDQLHERELHEVRLQRRRMGHEPS